MFTAESHDPFFLTRLRHEHPQLHSNHIGLVRLAHAASFDDLDDIDRELEVLTARRRDVLRRLSAYRRRLWPGMTYRHARRICRDEENPLPPAPVDADPLWGSDLRRMAVAVLRRHGAITLRELHGLLHRYGYVIDSARPVQRLADALAYEVRNGRLERVERGTYGPLPSSATLTTGRSPLPDPLPWQPPESAAEDPAYVDRAVDPSVRHDPDRWSRSAWPGTSQVGGSWCPGAPDPFIEELAEELDTTVAATRRRVADLLAEHLGPPPPRYDPGADLSWARTYPPRTPDPARPGTQSEHFGNDSSTIRSRRSEAEVAEAEDWWMWGADGPSAPE